MQWMLALALSVSAFGLDLTAGRELTLSWYRKPGLADAGRGLQIAEVWLIRR